jgi:hypothetical protein
MKVGIPKRKENRKASSRLSPRKSPVVTVAPERDSPGKMAAAWASPTSKACPTLGTRPSPSLTRSARKRSKAVKKSRAEAKRGMENIRSRSFPKIKARTMTGINPATKSPKYRRASFPRGTKAEANQRRSCQNQTTKAKSVPNEEKPQGGDLVPPIPATFGKGEDERNYLREGTQLALE